MHQANEETIAHAVSLTMNSRPSSQARVVQVALIIPVRSETNPQIKLFMTWKSKKKRYSLSRRRNFNVYMNYIFDLVTKALLLACLNSVASAVLYMRLTSH